MLNSCVRQAGDLSLVCYRIAIVVLNQVDGKIKRFESLLGKPRGPVILVGTCTFLPLRELSGRSMIHLIYYKFRHQLHSRPFDGLTAVISINITSGHDPSSSRLSTADHTAPTSRMCWRKSEFVHRSIYSQYRCKTFHQNSAKHRSRKECFPSNLLEYILNPDFCTFSVQPATIEISRKICSSYKIKIP